MFDKTVSMGKPLPLGDKITTAMDNYEAILNAAEQRAILDGLPLGLVVAALELKLFRYKMQMSGK